MLARNGKGGGAHTNAHAHSGRSRNGTRCCSYGQSAPARLELADIKLHNLYVCRAPTGAAECVCLHEQSHAPLTVVERGSTAQCPRSSNKNARASECSTHTHAHFCAGAPAHQTKPTWPPCASCHRSRTLPRSRSPPSTHTHTHTNAESAARVTHTACVPLRRVVSCALRTHITHTHTHTFARISTSYVRVQSQSANSHTRMHNGRATHIAQR